MTAIPRTVWFAWAALLLAVACGGPADLASQREKDQTTPGGAVRHWLKAAMADNQAEMLAVCSEAGRSASPTALAAVREDEAHAGGARCDIFSLYNLGTPEGFKAVLAREDMKGAVVPLTFITESRGREVLGGGRGPRVERYGRDFCPSSRAGQLRPITGKAGIEHVASGVG